MPEVQRTWILNDLINPLSPDSFIDESIEEGLPTEWHGLANGLTVPRGRRWGEAHFLIGADKLASLQNGEFSIKCFSTEVAANGKQIKTTTEWPGWYLESYTAVTKQANPAYWVKLADSRWLLDKSAVSADRYNLRTTSSTFVTATTNAGTPWTWQQVLGLLWAKLPAGIAGSCPTLPYTPSSTPENLWFDGIGCWRAINQVLTAIACVLVRDPFTGVFTFARLSVDQAGLSGQLARLPLLFDARPGATNYALPENVVAIFDELPVMGPTAYTPFHAKPFAEVVSIGGQQGKYEICDTKFHYTGNEAAITTRAAEVAAAIRWLLDPKYEPFASTYAGCREIAPGSRLTSVRWVSDGTRGFETMAFYEPEEIDWPKLPWYDEIPEEIIPGDAPRVVRFVLTSDLAYTADATATATVTATNDGSSTGGTITVIANWAIRGKTGAIGTAFRTNGGDYWIIDIALPQVVTGTLNADPTSAHQASIAITIDEEWDHAFSSDPLTVYNPNGLLYGAWSGSECTAKFNPVANRYELIAVQKFATRIRGTFLSLSASDTCTPPKIALLTGIDAPLPPALGSTIDFTNPTGWFIQTGQNCVVELNHATLEWEVCGTETPAFVTDVYLDGLVLKQRRPTGAFAVNNDCTTPSEILTGTNECPTPP